jgi:hypothetical protein
MKSASSDTLMNNSRHRDRNIGIFIAVPDSRRYFDLFQKRSPIRNKELKFTDRPLDTPLKRFLDISSQNDPYLWALHYFDVGLGQKAREPQLCGPWNGPPYGSHSSD